MKVFFNVCVKQYNQRKDFSVYRPASIDKPKPNSVMFVKKEYISSISNIDQITECLIFWPKDEPIPAALSNNNVFVISEKPHIDFCLFFKQNGIKSLPKNETFRIINGAFICDGAIIGENVNIYPGAYIGSDVVIGSNVYIGSGAKVLPYSIIGNNVIIRENAVIGADGLTTDRDDNGHALTMPQFGSVVIEDNVEIGANTVVAKGAIDETIIRAGSKIDNSTFVSHNVKIGKNTFIVGETILFGSSSVGDGCIISGNCTIMNRVNIGDNSILGAGAVATKSIPNNSVAIGCPAKVIREKRSGEEV